MFSCSVPDKQAENENPNIIIIYTDDLGYGDIGVYNKDSKIPTPNMDKLAQEGVLFTDAHSPAGICAPSRYSLLTGRYAWRAEGGTTLGHPYAQCKIEKGRPTIASVLKEKGYNTAQVGKWGIRHDYREALKDPNIPIDSIGPESFDYSKPIYAANTRGFDYAFTMLMLAVRQGDTYIKDKWYFENGFPYQNSKPDPLNFDWPACFPTITGKVIEYIETYAGERSDTAFRIDSTKPFFMYFDPHVPHEPIVPNEDFLGLSEAGDYGDFVVELDNGIGDIIKTLEKYGLKENTLIILSSDNGPERFAYPRIQEYGHYSMGDLRGVKRDIWEGGHRVPLIANWPKQIKPGTVCNESVGVIDLFSTLAALTKASVSEGAGEDSYNILPALLGQNYASPIRGSLIYHSLDDRFAIRHDEWVFIDAASGMVSEEPEWLREQNGVLQHQQKVELFNLKDDPKQTSNVADQYPEKIRELKMELDSIMKSGV